MSRPFADSEAQQMPWLPGERFELALDSQKGVFTRPAPGTDLLTVTTHRAIQLRRQPGRATTTLLPLNNIVAVDIVDATRPTERLMQGLFMLGIGALLGWIAFMLSSVGLIAVVLGGVPALIGIYVITGYLFPDSTGELILRTGGYALHHPLSSQEARRGAYLFAHRLYELMVANGAPVEAHLESQAPVKEPEAAWEPGPASPWAPKAGWSAPSTDPYAPTAPPQDAGSAPEQPGPAPASEPNPQPPVSSWQRWRSTDES